MVGSGPPAWAWNGESRRRAPSRPPRPLHHLRPADDGGSGLLVDGPGRPGPHGDAGAFQAALTVGELQGYEFAAAALSLCRFAALVICPLCHLVTYARGSKEATHRHHHPVCQTRVPFCMPAHRRSPRCMSTRRKVHRDAGQIRIRAEQVVQTSKRLELGRVPCVPVEASPKHLVPGRSVRGGGGAGQWASVGGLPL